MLTDPIADLLTRIRNAVTLSKAKVELPNSKMKGKRVSSEGIML
jgi:ribosomal protein S8